jgi:1-deoxy-D-xylulose-5-phosphate synthase
MKLKDYTNVAQLKDLNSEELNELAADLSNVVIEECEKFEGHLSSNLAITDLTISLLRHFGFENKRYLFDTSYQAYSFKRMTDRQDFYETVHTPDGYSIFQEIDEGDSFSGGHTSISAVWAAGYNHLKDDKLVIEIIGDGSLATSVGLGGMLNFALSKNKGLFILNDNKQGIGLNQFNYLDWKSISEGMGYKFFEVDGHDYDAMEKIWIEFDKLDCPVFVKVNTIKGYRLNKEFPKDNAPHYISPNAIQPEGTIGAMKFITENYFKDLLKNDKDAIIFQPGMTYVFGLNKLKEQYPGQIIDAGIAEEIAIIEAAAAANAGKHVYFAVSATFVQRCYDQFVHDIMRNNSNINFIIINADVTNIGDSHHGIYDLNMYNAFENVKVFIPVTTGDVLNCLEASKNYAGPSVIRISGDLKISDALTENETSWIWNKSDSKKVVITYGNSYFELMNYVEINKINLNIVLATSLNPIDDKLISDLISKGYELFTFEHVFWKNNLASTIRAHYPDALVKDFSFKNIFIGRWGMDEMMKSNKMDLPFVISEILK